MRYKKIKKRVTAAALTMVTGLSLIFGTNLSVYAETVKKDQVSYSQENNFIINDIEYYNSINNQLSYYDQSGPGRKSFDLYKDMLLSPFYTNPTTNKKENIADQWIKAALWIQQEHANPAYYRRPLVEAIYRGELNIWEDSIKSGKEVWYNGEIIDSYAGDIQTIDSVQSTGLRFASSMKAAEEAMIREHTEHCKRKATMMTPNKSLSTTALSEDATLQPVYYTLITSAQDMHKVFFSGESESSAFGVVFSDFKIKPILPSQDKGQPGLFKRETGLVEDSLDSQYQTGTENDSGAVATAEQSLEKGTTAEVNSEYSYGKEFSWEEGIEIGNEWSLNIGPFYEQSLSQSFHVTTSQAVSEAWSKGKSTSDSVSNTSTVNVAMPPYTQVLLQTGVGKVTEKTSWTSPVALSYKVTIVDYALSLSEASSKILATFPEGDIVEEPSNAQESFKYRYENRNMIQESNLNWEGMIGKSKLNEYQKISKDTNMEPVIDILNRNIPAVMHADSITSVYETTYQKVCGLKALYPLTHIRSSNDIQEYHLITGDKMYPESIDLTGLNDKEAEFYGFTSQKGHWILEDENGNDISTGSRVASLHIEPGTGAVQLIAGDMEGTVYLKYIIDEDYYNDIAKGMNITNDTIDTYKVPVYIKNVSLNGGKITVSGEQSIVAGDPAESARLETDIRNVNGKEVMRPIHWYANDLDTVIVTQDKFFAPKDLVPGMYPVVAYVGSSADVPELYSDPYDIQVLEARKFAHMTIPEKKVVGPSERMVNLNNIQIDKYDQYKDTQYDRDFNTNYPVSSVWSGTEDVIWTCENKDVVIEKGQATFPAENGEYTLTASSVNEQGENIVSNQMQVVITGYAERIAAESGRMDSDGGTNEITLSGPDLADNILVAAFKLNENKPDVTGLTVRAADGTQKAELVFPKNQTDEEITYTIKIAYDGKTFEENPVTSVVVASPEAGRKISVRYDIGKDAEYNDGETVSELWIPAGEKDIKFTVAKEIPVREGYHFICWNTAVDGKGTKVDPESILKLDKDTVLYAQWEKEETGKWIEKNNKKYYMDKNGKYVVEWNLIDGQWYYFNSKGEMQTGWILLNDKWYYLQESGVMATDLYKINNEMYYFNSKGEMQTGWQQLQEQWYYFNENGAMAAGWKLINGNWYYFDETGMMKTGWVDINGKYYYCNPQGIMTTGWEILGGKWYYFSENGAMTTGWNLINEKWYYFDESGAMITGWKEIGGVRYHFNVSGAMDTGWQYIDNNWYYFNESGIFTKNWIKVADKWYYMNDDGEMQTGWKKIDDKWYYLGDDGSMAVGWMELGGVWYWFEDSGVMATGWKFYGEKWYFFDENGNLKIVFSGKDESSSDMKGSYDNTGQYVSSK